METGDVLGGSVADASVRPATAGDADAIGAVQARAWQAAYADLLPQETLAGLTGAALADPWRAAVTTPPSPRHAVLVAASGATVVGFVAVAPATDPDLGDADGEISALVVDPAHQRRGHGSRLLSAAVATLRDQGCPGVVTWLPDVDVARQTFLATAGMVADGARRGYELPDGRAVTEIRYTAALADEPSPAE